MNAMGMHGGRIQAPAAERQKALALTYHRLMLMMLVFAGITAVIASRLILLQVFSDKAVAAGGNPLLPARGDIVDRNGVPLARSFDAWTIGVHPAKLVGNPADVAAKLAELMPEKSAAEYLAIMKSGKTFAYLSRRAMPELVSAVNAIGEPGLVFEREPERLYPNLGLAAHVLGYTDLDGQGAAGVERAFNDRLARPDLRGQPVQLAMDARIQQALEAELGAAMAKFSAVGAAGIVMDIKTGEVLAMTSLPELNPNAPGRGSMEARFNRATLGVYELGSTFKPFTVAMAMDDGHVKSLARCTTVRARSTSVTTPSPTRIRSAAPARSPRSCRKARTSALPRSGGPHRWAGSAERVSSPRWPSSSPVSIELKERGARSRRATIGARSDHDGRLRSRHRGHADLPCLRLCDVANGACGGGDVDEARQEHPVPPAGGCSARTRRTRCARCSAWSSPRYRPDADAPGYRVGGKTGSAEKYHNRSLLVTTFAGRFRWRPALCDRRHAGTSRRVSPKPTASAPQAGTSRRWCRRW
jgi:cell division protein FtsI (penicillin-binding protein 3)